MNKRQFIQERRPDWARFEILVEQLGRVTRKHLPAEEVGEFSRLLRKLSNDLAIIRSRDWGQDLVEYLNHLVARGYGNFYTAPPGNLAKFVRYVSVDFPQLFRANIGYFFVACALFFLPGAISWAVVQTNPELATRILPGPMLDQFDQMYGPNTEESETEDASETATEDSKGAAKEETDEESLGGGFEEMRTAMAGFYVYNNVGIALACFARGILLGVGTVYTLLFNGIFIGAIGGYIVSQGNGERFVSFIISHGSFELTAIAVSGGAGLMLGNALLHPGERSRLESLRVRGLDAVQIACGAAVMLMVAALIEAFWSPSGVPAMAKYIVGSGLWVLVMLYLGLAGREK